MSVSRVGRRLMADEYRDWTTGLWGCGDCSLLCKAWWCPCRVYDYLATVLGCNTFGGQRQGQGQGGVSACCVYCIAPEPLRVYLLHDMRNKLRQSGNIKPVSNKCREMCLLFCCEPCVLRQMMREVACLNNVPVIVDGSDVVDDVIGQGRQHGGKVTQQQHEQHEMDIVTAEPASIHCDLDP